jgi:hypothetical protein
LGHIVFAIFANPGLAVFFDEKFESAPLQRGVHCELDLGEGALPTDGSNPVPSSGESGELLTTEAHRYLKLPLARSSLRCLIEPQPV